MPLLLLVLLLPIVLLALMPVILVQRYRVGTRRRQARPWVATLSVVGMAVSVALFMFSTALTTYWVPRAFAAASAGLGIGCVLGLAGLLLTRWEPTVRTLHYTPNRWLILVVTLVVSARVLYGFWRAWDVAQSSGSETSILSAFGVAESLAAGGIVLGYYLAYSAGLRWRIRRWQQRPLRVM